LTPAICRGSVHCLILSTESFRRKVQRPAAARMRGYPIQTVLQALEKRGNHRYSQAARERTEKKKPKNLTHSRLHPLQTPNDVPARAPWRTIGTVVLESGQNQWCDAPFLS